MQHIHSNQANSIVRIFLLGKMQQLTWFALATFTSLWVNAAQLNITDTTELEPESHHVYEIETVAEDLNFPWSIAFLPSGDRLIAELAGNVRKLDMNGNLSEPLGGVPEVYRAGQGGLFDVLPAQDFATSQIIYLSYAAGDGEANATTVARGKLVNNTLENVEVIFSVSPQKYAALHYGGRIAWLSDGTLLLTTGDGFDFREKAQDVNNMLGKTLRMNADGSAAAGNPFPDSPYVYTLGHRNPQGLTVTSSGDIYLHEHGPQGGDEVNLLQAGANYGWPAIGYGLDYNGAYVSPFKEYPGMQQPKHAWVPSIAPSGFMVYEGDMFPEWQGDLFVGALVDAEVRRLDVEEGNIIGESALFPEIKERIRDVRTAPDGSIYVITDGVKNEGLGGSVLRIYR